jgi:poly-gamma-glutamate synthesis protein (capsule biosynthesis protein)
MNAPEPIAVSLALCGDVMTGRGVDQILPHPSDPVLYEDYVHDALEYVGLAIHANGPVSFPVGFDYIWGDALAELRRADMRIVNLETSITTSAGPWPGKGIHYRMHPQNVGCLAAARIDCCGLANNHVLDWGYAGLAETLHTLDEARIAHAGAGRNAGAASAPVALAVPAKGRVLVLALGSPTSGIPPGWAAETEKAGVNILTDLSTNNARRIAQEFLRITRPDDIAVVSIHWGGNWGYEIPTAQISFARQLVDEGIDIVHGHSAHHRKAIEIRRGHLILYGCGDFVNDYEGISGHEEYRGDLTLLYRITMTVQPRRLADVTLLPMQVRRLRLNRASADDAKWLASVLSRECARFQTDARLQPDGTIRVRGQ